MPNRLNPFSGLIETKHSPYARVLRQSFWQKLENTFDIAFGVSHYETYKDYKLGLTDYLLIAPYFFKQLAEWSSGNWDSNILLNKIAAQLLYFPANFIHIIFLPLKILLALAITIIAAPIIAIVHIFSLFASKKIWDEAVQLRAKHDNQAYTLKDIMGHKVNSMSPDEGAGCPIVVSSSIPPSKEKFGLTLNRGTLDQCDVIFDHLNTDLKQKKAMQALLHLNLFQITKKFEVFDATDDLKDLLTPSASS